MNLMEQKMKKMTWKKKLLIELISPMKYKKLFTYLKIVKLNMTELKNSDNYYQNIITALKLKE